ncbi:tRNA-dihydrouridine(20/20a) synthase [Methylorubrum suomiense]|uniref:tRNA-dihydrouridine(20/20a) synthase n=3 Tax=Methylorubrum suomiense TaxID=144191 RepID=A0ABQ4UQ11_9HYPH|nr:MULTISPECIES: tRNA dihydrouridine(20/20a) synthase DusA [Methylobacteriaceae]GJE73735.1 tRNA-dihydrouridine(20/20a) synthase [Methylorubrum suomiense]
MTTRTGMTTITTDTATGTDPRMIAQDLRFSVAPMMDWTDRQCRAFHRVLSRRARLYTEMVTTGAVLHGDRERLLGFDAVEQPVAVQLGGSDPGDLARAARIAEAFGYAEVNLNVGCPSDRVQDGRFGACLMREPALVGDCVAAMKAAVSVPVTVKCRLGVDDQDTEEALDALAGAVVAAGVDGLIVHARKAWLKGLSPRENRDVPPLDYGRVARLKATRPDLPIAINGGVRTIGDACDRLAEVDGVMIGRAAYTEPALLLEVDPEIFGEPAPVPDAFAAVEALAPTIHDALARGMRLHAFTRHMLGLFNGRPGARAFRRHLATAGMAPDADLSTLRAAVAKVSRERPPARAAEAA